MPATSPISGGPPQGNVDNCVHSIAEEVLGLCTVLWRRDANNWCLDDNFKTECPADNKIGQSFQSATMYVNKYINGKKDPGIVMLEHKFHKPSIELFKNYYPPVLLERTRTLSLPIAAAALRLTFTSPSIPYARGSHIDGILRTKAASHKWRRDDDDDERHHRKDSFPFSPSKFSDAVLIPERMLRANTFPGASGMHQAGHVVGQVTQATQETLHAGE